MMGRTLLTVLAVAIALNLLVAIRDQHDQAANASQARLSWRQAEILHVRAHTHACQDELHINRRPVAQTIITGGQAYRRWVLRSWRHSRTFYCGAVASLNSDPRRAIRYVFGPHANEALHVAYCETGGTYNIWASNGQYQGLFQMGSFARARYGHGSTPLRQAFAARRYYRDAGWTPWACRP